LSVIGNSGESSLQNVFNTLPMGIMEVDEDEVRFLRVNQSYRDFTKRFFGFEPSSHKVDYDANPTGAGSTFMALLRECCDTGSRAFLDEKMPDGSVVHSFARRIGANPVSGTIAVVVAVLSITEPDEGSATISE
jgi:hypothetical protein